MDTGIIIGIISVIIIIIIGYMYWTAKSAAQIAKEESEKTLTEKINALKAAQDNAALLEQQRILAVAQADAARAEANAAMGKLETPWQCIPGIKAPVRRNYGGEVACYSIDGKNCLWQASDEACNTILKTLTSSAGSISCGDNHKKLFGVNGYSDPAHWCAKARAKGL